MKLDTNEVIIPSLCFLGTWCKIKFISFFNMLLVGVVV